MDSQDKNGSSSYRLHCFTRCFQRPPTPERKPEIDQKTMSSSESKMTKQKKPGGWKTMPYILGNETFERLATVGLQANFMVYLMKVFHMQQVPAANILNIWQGISNFSPLLGAFISDAYVGRFKTIAFASFSSLLGMMVLTLTAWLPYMHPPKCDPQEHCESASSIQLAALLTGLGFLTVGTGGIRPCSIPFGVDQFDPTTEEGIKAINSFYNWYYTTFTIVILITLTLVVYIQDSVSWVAGFGIPTICMACSIVLFFVGTKLYVHEKPQGSIFSGITQVCVAAYKKRRIKLPADDELAEGIYYDPPPVKGTKLSKLPLTNQFRFLNKAAFMEEADLKPDGFRANQWRLCSVQQVEELKCLLKIFPIWASGIISFTSMAQQGTFTVTQALIMDRHLGPKFQIPAASIFVISMITLGIWLPFYDRFLVPALRKITKQEGGITLLQRIGIGIIFSVLSMVAAGLVERDRRISAIAHPKKPAMSVFWLAPQLALMGFCEAFNLIGQIEFYNKQFPDHMRSIANSVIFCSVAGSNYLSTFMITIVHKVTRTSHHPDWLTNDLNSGRLDYFYFLLAGMGILNFAYFVWVALFYRYKVATPLLQDKSAQDLEMSSN